MLLLADENFPKRMVDMLCAEGNEVVWARTHRPGWKDSDLLDFAESEARIVLIAANHAWAGQISIVAPDGIQMLSAGAS
jgi:predicted nuclease of predicted toxin-antitoxin system